MGVFSPAAKPNAAREGNSERLRSARLGGVADSAAVSAALAARNDRAGAVAQLQGLLAKSPNVRRLGRLRTAMNDSVSVKDRARIPQASAANAETLSSETPSRPVVVQRAKLNIRKMDGTISGVSNFIARPPSNLGFQGQHLTAYVAFEQTMLSRVRDRLPTQAAAELREVIREIKALPAMETPNQWNRHIHRSLDMIDQNLQHAAGMNEKNAARMVGTQIDGLLRERNRVPGTAISEVGTHGHGEATNAGALEVMETALRTGTAQHYGAAEMKQAVECSWHLFDYDPPDATDAKKLEKIQIRVLTHVMSVRTAFPHVFDWLSTNSNYWLIPYLRANRATFAALQRVSDQNLLLVQNYVHTNL
jgi:hypothetical protein